MPVPEGLESSQPGGLQDPPVDDIIDLTEEVVIVPLYGIVHDSPVITAVQKATRRGRKNLENQKFVEETQWIDDKILIPIALKIIAKIDELKGKDKEDK